MLLTGNFSGWLSVGVEWCSSIVCKPIFRRLRGGGGGRGGAQSTGPPYIRFIKWFCNFCFNMGFDIHFNGYNEKYEASSFLSRFFRVLWKFGNFVETIKHLNFAFWKKVLELCRTATIKPRQIERSGFFYWNTIDKLEVTDWSQVDWMFGCGKMTT